MLKPTYESVLVSGDTSICPESSSDTACGCKYQPPPEAQSDESKIMFVKT